jgi:imidazole glycerol-phosphate synthase subunit HisH
MPPVRDGGRINMKTITIIDYGAGNLKSVVNAITHLGYEIKLTNRKQDILDAGIVILPGVGAGGDTMDNLNKLDLSDAIRKVVEDGKPFLGVCIGLQVLFTYTEEDGRHDCLDVVPGKVQKLPGGLKVPHMGWNQVRQMKKHPVFEGIPDMSNFYFVHSYYPVPDDKSTVLGETEYGITFASAVARENLVATQFHPEKSGAMGLKFYDNFIKAGLRSISL